MKAMVILACYSAIITYCFAEGLVLVALASAWMAIGHLLAEGRKEAAR